MQLLCICEIERHSESTTLRQRYVNFLAGITLAVQAIPPIPTYFSIRWSVSVSYVCRLSHSCTLLKPFDRFRCHLAGTLVGSSEHCVRWGPDSRGTGDLGVKPKPERAICIIANCSHSVTPYLCCHLANTNEEWRVQRFAFCQITSMALVSIVFAMWQYYIRRRVYLIWQW